MSEAGVSRGYYRHWKGGTYFVSGIAVMDGGPPSVHNYLLVIYESVEGCREEPQTSRARLLNEFTALVPDRDGHMVPRFTRVENWR